MQIKGLFAYLELAFGELPCLEDYDMWPEADKDLYDDYQRAYDDIGCVYREFARRHQQPTKY